MLDFEKIMETNHLAKETALAVMSLLSGYSFTGDQARDDRFLAQFGIKRLTAVRDAFGSHTETAFDRAVFEEMVGLGRGNDTEDEFIIEKDGVQMLVARHAGVWLVGSVYYVVKTHKLSILSESEISARMDAAAKRSGTIKRDTYEVVCWPDVQHLMDMDGFDENSYLIDDEKGLDDFGSSAYFVDSQWLTEHGC